MSRRLPPFHAAAKYALFGADGSPVAQGSAAAVVNAWRSEGCPSDVWARVIDRPRVGPLTPAAMRFLAGRGCRA